MAWRYLLIGCIAALGIVPAVRAGDDAAACDFIWLSTPPRTLDPVLATGDEEKRLLDCLFDGLTRLDPETLAPQPAVATAWSVSPDGRRITFTLREDACWSNGDPLLAQHFVDAWKHALDPVTGCVWAFLFSSIRHARAYVEHPEAIERLGSVPEAAEQMERLRRELASARAHLGVDEGFWASGPHTLTVELEVFAPYFPALVAQAVFLPRHPTNLIPASHATDPSAVDPPAGAEVPTLLGNGPYVLAQAGPVVFRLERSKAYRGEVRGAFDRLELRADADTGALWARYAAGEGDWLPTAPRDALPHADAYTERLLLTYFLWLNTTGTHLRDPRVRRALSLAIDRSALWSATSSFYVPCGTLVAPGLPQYASGKDAAEFDVVAARALMRRAGHVDADGDGRLDAFPVLTFLYNANETHALIARNVAQQWATNLGIDVTIDSADWTTFQDRLAMRDYDLARGGWIADYPDPSTFLDLLRRKNADGRNSWFHVLYEGLLGHIDDPVAFAAKPGHAVSEVVSQLDARKAWDHVTALDVAWRDVLRAQSDRERLNAYVTIRRALQQAAEQILIDDAPVIPLGQFQTAGLVRPWIAGLHANAQGYHPIRELRRR